MYALAAARHMHEFGTTREQLAEVAVAARAWALLNPHAYRHASRAADGRGRARRGAMISEPLGVLDCCLVTDGGGALVVTSAERARALRPDPAYVLGVGEAHWHRDISAMPDLTTTAAAESGARAFAMAGLTPADVDVRPALRRVHDQPDPLPRGPRLLRQGRRRPVRLRRRGSPPEASCRSTPAAAASPTATPACTGSSSLIEAVRQLRGEAGDRQQPAVDVTLAHGNGAVLSAQATALLGRETALG